MEKGQSLREKLCSPSSPASLPRSPYPQRSILKSAAGKPQPARPRPFGVPRSPHPGQLRQTAWEPRHSPGQAVRDLSLPRSYPSSKPQVRFSLAGGGSLQDGASSLSSQNGGSHMAFCPPFPPFPLLLPRIPFTPPKTPFCPRLLPQPLPLTISSCLCLFPKLLPTTPPQTSPPEPRHWVRRPLPQDVAGPTHLLVPTLPLLVPTLGIPRRRSWNLEVRAPESHPLLRSHTERQEVGKQPTSLGK